VKATATFQLAAGLSVAPHPFDVMTNSPLFEVMGPIVSGAPPALTNMMFCDALEVVIFWHENFMFILDKAAYGLAPPIPVPAMSTLTGAGASSLSIPGRVGCYPFRPFFLLGCERCYVCAGRSDRGILKSGMFARAPHGIELKQNGRW
jgi:hypothetical protein